MTTNHRQTVEKRSDKSPRRAQDAATPTSKKQAPLGFLSAYLKNWFPRLWRFFYGVKIPNSKRYEDYCETTRSTVLAKDQLGQAGERYMFEWLCNQPRAQVVACNTENYYCEIDIVFLDHATREIVFLEVKTRSRNDPRYPHALFAVDAKRRKKLALAGRTFRSERGYLDYQMRFDVAVLFMPKDSPPKLEYYKEAFHYVKAVEGYSKTDFGKERSDKRLREDLKKRRRDD